MEVNATEMEGARTTFADYGLDKKPSGKTFAEGEI